MPMELGPSINKFLTEVNNMIEPAINTPFINALKAEERSFKQENVPVKTMLSAKGKEKVEKAPLNISFGFSPMGFK